MFSLPTTLMTVTSTGGYLVRYETFRSLTLECLEKLIKITHLRRAQV